MSGLTVLSEPSSGNRADLADWIRSIAHGAIELLAEAASSPRPLDTELVAAMAWLGIDRLIGPERSP